MPSYYVGNIPVGGDDIFHYGVKGMRWGVVNEEKVPNLFQRTRYLRERADRSNARAAAARYQYNGAKRTSGVRGAQARSLTEQRKSLISSQGNRISAGARLASQQVKNRGLNNVINSTRDPEYNMYRANQETRDFLEGRDKSASRRIFLAMKREAAAAKAYTESLLQAKRFEKQLRQSDALAKYWRIKYDGSFLRQAESMIAKGRNLIGNAIKAMSSNIRSRGGRGGNR